MPKSKSMESNNSQVKVDWITPDKYLAAVRKVFGRRIILDVASDTNANQIVKAMHIFTKDDDGLTMTWYASNVYCNPPGSEKPGVSNVLPWLEKMNDEYLKGHFQAGVFCVFNCDVSTRWFQRFCTRRAMCLPDHRVDFLNAELKPQGRPRHPNAFIYFGNNDPLFSHVFGQFGVVIPAQLVRR